MKKAGFIFLGLIVWISAAGLQAAPFEYQEGTHYERLNTPVNTRESDKVVVTEYFSYGCPHCYRFDPMISKWKTELPADVEFRRSPAVWNQDYKLYAQIYYTAEALEVLEEIHTPLFQAIHAQGMRLNDPKRSASFFSEFGVDPNDFAKVFSSFGVRAAVQQAQARGRAYRASGVPAIIVNGKYRIEGSMAGSNPEMLEVAEYLISRERQALAASE
ncbi:MAG: thiol:disulfide interchange protein DsbA/DsbL [Pseudomonadales bacterium]